MTDFMLALGVLVVLGLTSIYAPYVRQNTEFARDLAAHLRRR